MREGRTPTNASRSQVIGLLLLGVAVLAGLWAIVVFVAVGVWLLLT